MQNPFSLLGKTILVTGASSGFGRAIAIACSEAGANVVLTARNINRLNETLSLLSGTSHRVLQYDMLNRSEIDIFVDNLPKLDGIVLCAGIQQIAPIKFTTDEIIESTLNTNTISYINIIQRLLKKNMINKGGSVVFISSIATKVAAVGNGVYAASKGAIDSFSKILAIELSKQKIRSNAIAPGSVRTGINDANMLTEEDIIKEETQYPLGAGRVEDIAYCAQYLLSDAARWITGTTITIDGGISII